VLKAWLCAHICAGLGGEGGEGEDEATRRLEAALRETNRVWPGLLGGLEGAGWDLEVGALETRGARRVRVVEAGKKGE